MTTTLSTDANSDAAAIIADAKQGALAVIADIVSGLTKILNAAAGDVPELLTDSEAAAIPAIVANVSPAIRPEVQMIAGLLAGPAEAAIVPIVTKETQIGLALGLLQVQHFQAGATAIVNGPAPAPVPEPAPTVVEPAAEAHVAEVPEVAPEAHT